MRKLMQWVLIPALVAAGAALTVATPAQAAKPIRVGFKSPAQLQALCNQLGGFFDTLGGNDSVCILPDGRFMVCFESTNECSWHYKVAPKTDWRDNAVLGDLVLQNPPPSQPTVPDTATVTSVLSR